MNWDSDEHRLALLELHDGGRLRRREGQRDVWAWLAELSWTRRTARRDELALVEGRRGDLEAMLDTRWPQWRETRERLASANLPITHEGWKALQDEDRAKGTGPLPPRLNTKTATAVVGPHSKARLTAERRQALGDVELTRDGIVRLRPNIGLILERGESSIEASTLASLAGEVVLNERSLTSGTVLAGRQPAAALLVENLGPYLDVQVPEDWMIIHVPGWNTATVKHVLDQLGSVPLVHFGDLDPEGVEIVAHLRRSYPRLRWAVPAFWKEFVPDRAQRKNWPEDIALDCAPALVHELKQSSLWLEQETIVLDPRLANAFQRTLEVDGGRPVE